MTDKKEIEELAKLVIEWKTTGASVYEPLGKDVARQIIEAGYTKSKLVELDWRKVSNWLISVDKSTYKNLGKVGNGSFGWSEYRTMIRDQLAKAICSKFGTKKVDAERIIEILGAEPELPGDMSDEMWDSIDGDRYATQRVMQLAVKLTKDNIRRAIVKKLENK